MPPSGDTEGLLLNETDGSWAAADEASLPANAAANSAVVAQNVQLNSVSCASAGNCTAVGSYVDSSGAIQGLLLTETAGSWATGVEAALPAGAVAGGAFLESVSCPSAGHCSAVGDYTNSSFDSDGLLLTETAGSWAPGVAVSAPANALALGAVFLSSVSCASAGNCSAVGEYTDNSHGQQGLLLSETAGTWATGVEAALPATAMATDPGPGVSLGSVSCASAGNCGAVGQYFDSSRDWRGVALTESGGKWATGIDPQLPADAGGYSFDSLDSVSCPSAGNCGAVGSYSDGSSNNQGLLVTETAGLWGTGAEAALPANATVTSGGQSVSLYSVSCPSTTNCTAGGSYTGSSKRGVGNGQSGLLLGGASPMVRLNISKNGTGSGNVSGVPTGIRCGATCSASFDAGTSLTLIATPSPDSRFSGWSGGGCKATGPCPVNTDISGQTVTATFTLLPKCVVPKLTGKTLRAAKHSIRTHHCAPGKITHASSRTIKKGRVISQKPKPGSRLKHGARVNLAVSKGSR
jgi:hypothetical protein